MIGRAGNDVSDEARRIGEESSSGNNPPPLLSTHSTSNLRWNRRSAESSRDPARKIAAVRYTGSPPVAARLPRLKRMERSRG